VGDLRDQLLKAGLVSQTDVKSVEKADQRAKKAKGAKQVQREQAARHERAQQTLAQQAEADRARALAQLDVKAQGELQQRVAQIVSSNPVTVPVRGRRRWYFEGRQERVPFLELSDEAAELLERGQAAIVQPPDRGPASLVPADAARRILELDPTWVRAFSGRR
jgi:uncharacterized protein YaiL (DUF2058 family)